VAGCRRSGTECSCALRRMIAKNVAQGRFEYSHSPDNRALTKPYPVTTYLVANYSAATNPQTLRPSAHMQGRYAARQILIVNLIKTCPFHQERELRLVWKLLHRRRQIDIGVSRTAHYASYPRQHSSKVHIEEGSKNRIRRS